MGAFHYTKLTGQRTRDQPLKNGTTYSDRRNLLPFSRAVLSKTKMEDLSVLLLGEDSEESEILNELVEESDDLLLLVLHLALCEEI